MMNKEILKKMVEGYGYVDIVIDAINGHGGYSAGQMHFEVDEDNIDYEDEYAIFKGINADFDTSKRKFNILLIPYDRIIGVGVRDID